MAGLAPALIRARLFRREVSQLPVHGGLLA